MYRWKKQVVVLKKEIYVEGTKEEIEEWLKENQFNDSNYKWRETVEYVQSDSETVEVMEVPEQDEFNFLRFKNCLDIKHLINFQDHFFTNWMNIDQFNNPKSIINWWLVGMLRYSAPKIAKFRCSGLNSNWLIF